MFDLIFSYVESDLGAMKSTYVKRERNLSIRYVREWQSFFHSLSNKRNDMSERVILIILT